MFTRVSTVIFKYCSEKAQAMNQLAELTNYKVYDIKDFYLNI